MTIDRHTAHEKPTGAQVLLDAAAGRGVSVCFANPGTTEMPLVTALDRTPGMRAVLGLHENVCTGAADGYARIARRAALTLLHLGPGLANGLANLHNARRAHSPVVNVVGDHASWHLPFDAPLTSDIAALASTVGAHHEIVDRVAVAAVTRRAIDDAHERLGVSTLVVPADLQQLTEQEPPQEEKRCAVPRPGVEGEAVEQAARRLRAAGSQGVLLLGGEGLSRLGQFAAGRISAATGARLYSETFPARAERGGGLPPIDRLPYFPETAVEALRDAAVVVLAGAPEPVAYFGYEGMPSRLAPQRTLHRLADVGQDVEQALVALAELVGVEDRPAGAQPLAEPAPGAALTGQTVGAALASRLPEHAIVSVEGGTCGYPFYSASAAAVPHTVMTNTGGAIGQGLPAALGAAIAAPERPVIALQSDGSGLYTAQALWTMARESADVVVLIAANHTYNVLRTELARHGSTEPGPQAARLTSLGEPAIDWVSLARGFGVPASDATTVGELCAALGDALRARGPHLIQMTM
ncbi:acetolactate synthase large subunit [Nonomuraea guangzhouensis]|uniref:Acetolactate synthase large subunit n=1 Tax=Nonomuraea guangzhouensis TaxID=1291555 RepID=A0ABW4G863_9ACTN|nr:acetolactate synthase large subunit [Nonomuraea guangzhouensis]